MPASTFLNIDPTALMSVLDTEKLAKMAQRVDFLLVTSVEQTIMRCRTYKGLEIDGKRGGTMWVTGENRRRGSMWRAKNWINMHVGAEMKMGAIK